MLGRALLSTAKEKQGADGIRAAKASQRSDMLSSGMDWYGVSWLDMAADDLPSKGKELKGVEAKCKGTALIISVTRRKSIAQKREEVLRLCNETIG